MRVPSVAVEVVESLAKEGEIETLRNSPKTGRRSLSRSRK